MEKEEAEKIVFLIVQDIRLNDLDDAIKLAKGRWELEQQRQVLELQREVTELSGEGGANLIERASAFLRNRKVLPEKRKLLENSEKALASSKAGTLDIISYRIPVQISCKGKPTLEDALEVVFGSSAFSLGNVQQTLDVAEDDFLKRYLGALTSSMLAIIHDIRERYDDQSAGINEAYAEWNNSFSLVKFADQDRRSTAVQADIAARGFARAGKVEDKRRALRERREAVLGRVLDEAVQKAVTGGREEALDMLLDALETLDRRSPPRGRW